MKKIYGILMLAMLALCSTALVSCGDDDEGGSESALLGTWYTSYDTKYSGKCEETLTFKSDHTFTWDYKYGGYDDGEPETGRWTLKDGIVGFFYSDGDADYMFFDGKQLKYPDIDDWDNDVYRIYTKKKGSSGSDDGNTGGQSGTLDGHDYVDLYLPSGTLWATCNVGATTPEGYGNYYAWGETTTKSTYSSSTYTYSSNPSELPTSADVAYKNWGSNWRMPSKAQFDELINSSYTTTEWTTVNGVNGRLITSKTNGNSIFLPAAGYRVDTWLDYAGSDGYYWSRTLRTDYPYDAWYLDFGSDNVNAYYNDRYRGQSVRPVRLSE